jgi:hypothetical protein
MVAATTETILRPPCQLFRQLFHVKQLTMATSTQRTLVYWNNECFKRNRQWKVTIHHLEFYDDVIHPDFVSFFDDNT